MKQNNVNINFLFTYDRKRRKMRRSISYILQDDSSLMQYHSSLSLSKNFIIAFSLTRPFSLKVFLNPRILLFDRRKSSLLVVFGNRRGYLKNSVHVTLRLETISRSALDTLNRASLELRVARNL